MAACVVPDIRENKMVGMGQIAVVKPPATLSAILGSCVGVALYHPRLRVGALAHVVLPDSTGRPANSAKFADTVIPAMLQELGHAGANHSGLIAKITGGACMFGVNGPLQVGLSNVEAVTRALAAVGIRLVAQDCGGSKGRRCSFDPATGSLTVEIMGSPAHVL